MTNTSITLHYTCIGASMTSTSYLDACRALVLVNQLLLPSADYQRAYSNKKRALFITSYLIYFLFLRHCWFHCGGSHWCLQVQTKRYDEHQRFPHAVACGGTRNRCGLPDRWTGLSDGKGVHI